MQSALNRFHRLAVILFCSLFLSVAISANSETQPDSESIEKTENSSTANRPKPIPRARWSEDWSTFGDASPLLYPEISPYDYFWAPINFIPLNESKDSYLSFGGELRLAYELYDEKDMGISNIGYQDALQLQGFWGQIFNINTWFFVESWRKWCQG